MKRERRIQFDFYKNLIAAGLIPDDISFQFIIENILGEDLFEEGKT